MYLHKDKRRRFLRGVLYDQREGSACWNAFAESLKFIPAPIQTEKKYLLHVFLPDEAPLMVEQVRLGDPELSSRE
jgi:hypothetical protein